MAVNKPDFGSLDTYTARNQKQCASVAAHTPHMSESCAIRNTAVNTSRSSLFANKKSFCNRLCKASNNVPITTRQILYFAFLFIGLVFPWLYLVASTQKDKLLLGKHHNRTDIKQRRLRGLTRSGKEAWVTHSHKCPLEFQRPDANGVLKGKVAPILFEPRPLSPCSNCTHASLLLEPSWAGSLARSCSYNAISVNRYG